MKLLGVRTLLGLGLLLLVVAAFLALMTLRGGSGVGIEKTFFDPERSVDDPGPTSNLEIEKEWPKKIELSGSKPVRLSLILNEDEGSIGPQPTPGERSDILLPEGYVLESATARLVGAGFEVREATDEVQAPEGRDRLEWVWNLAPLRNGRQTVTLNVSLELMLAAGGDTKRPEWTDNLVIDVASPDQPLFEIGDIPIVPIITGLLGSALSVPFFYTLWKERQASRGRSKNMSKTRMRARAHVAHTNGALLG